MLPVSGKIIFVSYLVTIMHPVLQRIIFVSYPVPAMCPVLRKILHICILPTIYFRPNVTSLFADIIKALRLILMAF